MAFLAQIVHRQFASGIADKSSVFWQEIVSEEPPKGRIDLLFGEVALFITPRDTSLFSKL